MKILLNQRLIEKQKLTPKEIEEIYALHEQKQKLYKLIEKEADSSKLPRYAEDLQALEFKLQEAWRFKKDANFHRFWETPRCTCPKMDNRENWGTDMYSVSGDCPLHKGKK